MTYQKGDMEKSRWHNGGWTLGTLGGEDTDTNLGAGLAVGTDLSYSTSYPIRLEGEYMYRGKAEWEKGPKSVSGAGTAYQGFDVRSHSLMANAYYDFLNESVLTPYVGLGLGMSYLKSDYRNKVILGGTEYSVSGSGSDWNLAWNIGGGVAWQLNDAMSLDFSYRYVDLGEVETGKINVGNYSTKGKADYTGHEFGIGLRMSGF